MLSFLFWAFVFLIGLPGLPLFAFLAPYFMYARKGAYNPIRGYDNTLVDNRAYKYHGGGEWAIRNSINLLEYMWFLRLDNFTYRIVKGTENA